MDPISIAIRIGMMTVSFMLWIFKLICKLGLFWLFAGYFIYYVLIENPTPTQHLLCLLLAWGGTFLNFFGMKIIKAIIAKRNEKKEYYEALYQAYYGNDNN